jgi:hypothetical protein
VMHKSTAHGLFFRRIVESEFGLRKSKKIEIGTQDSCNASVLRISCSWPHTSLPTSGWDVRKGSLRPDPRQGWQYTQG